jgi:hypothetical protein
MERAREENSLWSSLVFDGRAVMLKWKNLAYLLPLHESLLRTNLTAVSLPMEERAARKAGEVGVVGASRNTRSEGCDSSEVANGIWNLVGDMTS